MLDYLSTLLSVSWWIEEYKSNESYKFEAFFSRLLGHLSLFFCFLINHNLLFITLQLIWYVQSIPTML